MYDLKETDTIFKIIKHIIDVAASRKYLQNIIQSIQRFKSIRKYLRCGD